MIRSVFDLDYDKRMEELFENQKVGKTSWEEWASYKKNRTDGTDRTYRIYKKDKKLL